MSSLSKYSPELKDIIEQPQSKMGRFVFYFLFAFMALLLLLGFLIESPDIVIAETKVSSSSPPVTLKPKAAGRIHLIIDSIPAKVYPGQYLAIIDNAADYSDILALKNTVQDGWPFRADEASLRDDGMQMGELSLHYYSLKNASIRYKRLISKENEYDRKMDFYAQKRANETKELSIIQSSHRNSLQQWEIKMKQHREDSILFIKRAITESQFQESCLNYLNSQKYLIAEEKDIAAKVKAIDEDCMQIAMLHAEHAEALVNARVEVETKYKELLSQIRIWEDRYVLQSPSECTIEWANIISEGDYIEIGEPVFHCVFPNNHYYAVALLAGPMSGKVKVGQSVNIKLESYPYTEYGMLRGRVGRISMNSMQERGYLLYISLPGGLISTSGHVLSFAETIYGQAEIITERRKLITRVYHQIYDILTSRKKLITQNDDERNNPGTTLF